MHVTGRATSQRWRAPVGSAARAADDPHRRLTFKEKDERAQEGCMDYAFLKAAGPDGSTHEAFGTTLFPGLQRDDGEGGGSSWARIEADAHREHERSLQTL